MKDITSYFMKFARQIRRPFFIGAICTLAIFLITPQGQTQFLKDSPLEPVKTDHPRDTMRSFMTNMEAYRKAKKNDLKSPGSYLAKAIRTLDMSGVTSLLREESARESAILLKEVIDRVIVIDYEKIPNNPELTRWRLKGTEIVIAKIAQGDRAGEFLFSTGTVERVKHFYQEVAELPYLAEPGGAGYTTPWQENLFPPWAEEEVLGSQKWQWMALLIAIFLGYFLKLVTEIVIRAIKALTQEKKDSIRHQVILALEKPIGLIAAAGLWLVSIYYLNFEGIALIVLRGLIQLLMAYALIWASYRLVDVLSGVMNRLAQKTDTDLDDHLVPLVRKTLRVFVVVFGVLVLLQNFGINVVSLLAGLGLGGLAFALAAKDTAANFFGSIMILIDRPFKVGDWIKTTDAEGTVEEIGFRSTRIRTFYNSLVSIPNSSLVITNIDNMGRRMYRRVRTTLGVTYDTSPEKIEAFIEGIKEIVQANKFTRKDYFHICFEGYGAYSLDIMVYLFLKVPDWSHELVVRQQIYLEILRLAKELKVEFAFPTSTLHMETFPEKQATRQPEEFDKEELVKKAQSFGPNGSLAKPEGLGIYKTQFEFQSESQ